MDYEALINLLLENNKVLKEENKRLEGGKAGKCCGNCARWCPSIKSCDHPDGNVWFTLDDDVCDDWKKKEAIDVRCANCVDRYKINPVPTRCKDCLDPTGELKYPYFRPKKKE